MFDAVVSEEFKDCSCSIYDLRQKRWLVADATTATMRAAIRRELDWVDCLFENLLAEKDSYRAEDRPYPRSL